MRGGNEVAIFVVRRNRSEVLVCHRSDPLDAYWHTVAGGVEPGEAAEAAALRELCEETGLAGALLTRERTTYDYPLDEEPPHRRARYAPGVDAVHVDCFLVEAPDDWEPRLDSEHDAYRWCAPADAVELLRWDDTSTALRQLLERS
jgi:8-oxo-dGTP pyrophosphatase MutT (NUDIX family)